MDKSLKGAVIFGILLISLSYLYSSVIYPIKKEKQEAILYETCFNEVIGSMRKSDSDLGEDFFKLSLEACIKSNGEITPKDN